MPPKTKFSTIPEDEEPKTVKLNEESKLSSKFITLDCPVCHCKLQLRNEIEINPKGVKCKCNPCNFKIRKNDKTMSVLKNDDGDITLESEDHSISFSWNREVTPETEEEKTRNKMISDVMNTPRNNKSRLNDMD